MRILLYNWAPFDDPEQRGGGVRVYENNLIQHLESGDHEISVLSSGLEYDLMDQRVRIEPTTNTHGDKVRSYALVNSTVLAPGHQSFGSPQVFAEGEMLTVWHNFLRQRGPFDVVQFDSLEGIPLTFLRVHEATFDTQVVVYAHNYYIVCPQVNLWKDERVHCDDYHGGRDCVTCLQHKPNAREVERAHQLSRLLRSVGIQPGHPAYASAYSFYAWVKPRRRLFRALTAVGMMGFALSRPRSVPRVAHAVVGHVTEREPRLEPIRSVLRSAPSTSGGATDPGRSLSLASVFRERRERSVALVNAEVDAVLATSHRSRRVLAKYDIAEEKLKVAYIGTKAAEDFSRADRRKDLLVSGQLSLAYLGYMRRDKGFFFLLDALEACPPELRSHLRLVVAARGFDPQAMERLSALADSMVDVVHYDGYTHAELPRILRTVDVGVIPVQWEDNLPQVAIEMASNGVPLITSHRGGARELGGDNPQFVFTGSSAPGLIEIWRRVLEGELEPGDYWSSAMTPVTMEEHSAQLLELYADLLATRTTRRAAALERHSVDVTRRQPAEAGGAGRATGVSLRGA